MPWVYLIKKWMPKIKKREETQIIFRFESNRGIGAYTYCSFSAHTPESGHPGPYNCKIPHIEELLESGEYCNIYHYMRTILKCDDNDIIYGFKSLIQAYKWFSKLEVEQLYWKNVHLTAYEIPKSAVMELTNQIVFNKKLARKTA